MTIYLINLRSSHYKTLTKNMLPTVRSFTLMKCSSLPFPISLTKLKVNPRPQIINGLSLRSFSYSSLRENHRVEGGCGDSISSKEWQGWGSSSEIPFTVMEIVEDMRKLEKDLDVQMSFGGIGGKLQGNFRVQVDKKHRATYQALVDSEKKLNFFSARQIACRLLGNRGYLCQKCWLAKEDCMCSKIMPSSLWRGMRFWLYMHPKDFLRQNNTGKLLWQIFGVQAATLCIFGIPEHEEIMWNAFKHAGKSRVWCLYPDKNAFGKSVQDVTFPGSSPGSMVEETNEDSDHSPLNFILIDGTWNNSSAMFRRLKERAKLVWGEEDIPCISLSTSSESPMHKLRPQPSWERTCTAAAASSLLSELHLLPEFSFHRLDKQAEAINDGLDTLLEALTSRRVRKGRSTIRQEKHNKNNS